MKSLFEFPKELKGELRKLNEGYLSDFSEVSLDKYVRANASKEFLVYWEINKKRLQEERKKNYIIN